MDLGTFGGEFKLINALVKKVKHPEIFVDAGDDAAVIKKSEDGYTLISTELFIDGNHFDTAHSTPLQIGKKICEATISDIAAMGGKAKYLLIGAGLRKELLVSYLESIYQGIYSSCQQHDTLVIGGDTIKSDKLLFGTTIIGECHPKNLKLRSHAKEGDLIRVTGHLGGSTIGRMLLKKNISGHEKVKIMHLEPFCRMDLVDKLVPYAHAMIDVSDGLASEVRHICEKSHLGAEIFLQQVPIDKMVLQASQDLHLSALDAALYGGEDFELVYTISPENEKKAPGFTVGKITAGKKVFLVDKKLDTKKELTSYGFQHF